MSPAAPIRPRPPAAPPPDTSDAIGAWLDRLLRLTRLPTRQTAELREELDAHLRERARDLMLAGHDEPDAVHKAIAELGDLALLAHRYRDAHRTPKGRLIMNTILVTAVASALGLSTIALRQTEHGAAPAPVDSAPPEAQPPLVDAFSALRYRVGPGGNPLGFDAGQSGADPAYVVATDVGDQPLEQVLMGFGESSETSVFVYWSDLNQRAIDRDTELPDMPLAGQTVERSLRMLSNVLDLDGANRLDHRVESGLMEIATREFFAQRELDLDHRDRELVSYDAAELLGAEAPLARSEASATLIELVTTLVEPEMWECNGGIATISAAGNRLFVNASKRVHDRVAWLLAELMQSSDAGGVLEHPADGAAPQPGLSPAAAGESEHAFRISARDGRIRMEILDGARQPQVVEASEIEITGGTIIQVAGAATVYTIQPGDTLASIADHFLGSPARADELLAANAGLSPDALPVGRVILVPDTDPILVGIEGAVTRPGSFQAPPDGVFTLRRLLIAAGGSTPGADLVTVRRGEGVDAPVVHATTVAELARDPAADRPLLAGDRVEVGSR